MPVTLKEQLLSADQTAWIDIGCGGNFEEGFYYLDILPAEILNPVDKKRYFRIDIANTPTAEVAKLGKFDFVRLQHTFEHFSFEEGQQVLHQCAVLLKSNGIILITVPDLKIHVQKYLNSAYKNWIGFKAWANKRIPEEAPDSFYFSIFTYSMPYESHKWCYDYEGLAYQLRVSKEFVNIRELKFDDPLSSYPFTHNRPEEDLCVIAQKIS